jgi:glycosyltransferase involved in cell wall biosynthesis
MPNLVTLLGRGEVPADGVADYCANLGRALKPLGYETQIERVSWFENGWLAALARVWREARRPDRPWFLLQYTALGWSTRGLPIGAALVLLVLKLRGAKCGVMFHEPWRQGEEHPRAVDRVRAWLQEWTIHRLYGLSDRCIFSIPLKVVGWLPASDRKSFFISLGPNIPEKLDGAMKAHDASDCERTVSVFCLSPQPAAKLEVREIGVACRAAVTAGFQVRVVFVGRGTDDAAADISAEFPVGDASMEAVNLRFKEPPEIAEVIRESDVLFCVRGILNMRRGSALAGVACGIPVLGYAGQMEDTPLMDAGIVAVPAHDLDALSRELIRILSDARLRDELRERNVAMQRKYFSWDAISKAYVRALSDGDSSAHADTNANAGAPQR